MHLGLPAARNGAERRELACKYIYLLYVGDFLYDDHSPHSTQASYPS
jgi:hypothetical protein